LVVFVLGVLGLVVLVIEVCEEREKGKKISSNHGILHGRCWAQGGDMGL